MKAINTKEAPAAVGPYSQAIVANGFVYASGQIGLDPKTGALLGGLSDQTKQVLANLSEVLKAAGSDIDHVVKTTIFLTDMNDYAAVNELYAAVFSNTKPARATIAVAALPKAALVEIEAVALLK